MNETTVGNNDDTFDGFATIPDVPINPVNSINNPNQTRSGVTRGTQTVVGSDSSQITFGVVPSTNQLGVAEYDATNNKVLQLGQQADGSNALKFFNSSGVGVAQFGRFADGTTALKVAKSGFEVGSATNDQLIFNSGQDVFKIVSTSTTLIPLISSRGNSSSITITHGLGYIPVIIATAYGNAVNNYQPLPVMIPNVSNGQWQVYIDIENLTTTTFELWAYLSLNATNGSLAATTIRYYLLQETAN